MSKAEAPAKLPTERTGSVRAWVGGMTAEWTWRDRYEWKCTACVYVYYAMSDYTLQKKEFYSDAPCSQASHDSIKAEAIAWVEKVWKIKPESLFHG